MTAAAKAQPGLFGSSEQEPESVVTLDHKASGGRIRVCATSTGVTLLFLGPDGKPRGAGLRLSMTEAVTLDCAIATAWARAKKLAADGEGK